MTENTVVRARIALPFEPLNPDPETIAAMKSARRRDLVTAGKPGKLLPAGKVRSALQESPDSRSCVIR